MVKSRRSVSERNENKRRIKPMRERKLIRLIFFSSKRRRKRSVLMRRSSATRTYATNKCSTSNNDDFANARLSNNQRPSRWPSSRPKANNKLRTTSRRNKNSETS